MRARHNILFPFVGGDVVGGSHLSALKLIAALDPDRFSGRIVLHGGEGQLARVIEAHGLQWERLDRPGIVAPRYSRGEGDVSPVKYLASSLHGLRRRLKQWDIGLVHTNDGRMHSNWALPARLAGCRLVWHHRQSPDAFGVNWIAPVLADKIISVSRFACPARPLLPLGKRLHVIHSPFDLVAARPDKADAAKMARTALGAGPRSIILGYIGTLNTRKRPDHFVRVIAQLRSQLPEHDIHGAIFGMPERADHALKSTCEALAADLGIVDRLHMMGHVSPIEPWLAGLDALLVTAVDEPFGRTLIEAMHVGTPVIATRHGGNTEAIRDGETGFLVDPHDPSAFAEPLRRLLEQPDLRNRITAAASVGLEQFSTAMHVRRIESIYADLLDNQTVVERTRSHHA